MVTSDTRELKSRIVPEGVLADAGGIGLSWGFLSLTVAFFAMLSVMRVSVPLTYQAIVYVGSMVLLSLPHGGYEHFANIRSRDRRYQAKYVVGYLILFLSYGLVFYTYPVPAFLLSILVVALKGGGGDYHVAEQMTGSEHLMNRVHRHLFVLLRGGMVLLVPLVLQPGYFSVIADHMVGLFRPERVAELGWIYTPSVRQLVGLVIAAGVIVHLAVGYLAGGGEGWKVDIFETVLLLTYFSVVPVIIAVGLYFPFWYAYRQVVRVSVRSDGRISRVLRDVVKGCVLPTFGALLLLTGAYLVVPHPPGESMPWWIGWVALYSVFVSMLGLPHVLIGSLLEKRGIWHVSHI